MSRSFMGSWQGGQGGHTSIGPKHQGVICRIVLGFNEDVEKVSSGSFVNSQIARVHWRSKRWESWQGGHSVGL